MKRIVSILIITFIILSALTSCAKTVIPVQEDDPSESEPDTVLSTENIAEQTENGETIEGSEKMTSDDITGYSDGMVAGDVAFSDVLEHTDLIVIGKIVSESESEYTNPENDPSIINPETKRQVINCLETSYEVEISKVLYGDYADDKISVCVRNRMYYSPGVNTSDSSDFYLNVGDDCILFLRNEKNIMIDCEKKGYPYNTPSRGEFPYLIAYSPAGYCVKYSSESGETRFKSYCIDVSIDELETILKEAE